MSEKSVYVWNYRGGDAKAEQIRATGATLAWVKAGGDQGVVWIPGGGRPSWALPQWDDTYLAPLTSRGIAAYPWFYNWPGEEDKGAVVRALEHRWSDAIALNPETEWRVQSRYSPYATLAQGNEYAFAWVMSLRERIEDRFRKVPRIWFSSVPSWGDFPYEGFHNACDGAHPQHYWHDNLMPNDGETGAERGEDQVEAHLRRVGKAKPCVPILTACREYDDAGVLDLARGALGDYPDLAGFSSWEAGNASWQADAMRQSYALLPEDHVTTSESPFIRAFKSLWAA